MDPDCYQQIRSYAAKHPETTLRDIIETAVEQYLRGIGEWVDSPIDTVQGIRLRGGRRPKGDILEDAFIVVDGDSGMGTESDLKVANHFSVA
jgi:hypothetical protein